MSKQFDEFWMNYPKKSGKQDAESVWNELDLDRDTSRICQYVRKNIKSTNINPASFLRSRDWMGGRKPNIGYQTKAYTPVAGKKYANPQTWTQHDEQQKLEIIDIWEVLGKQGLLDILINPANPDDYKYKTYRFLGVLQRDGYLTGNSPKQCCVASCGNPGAMSAGTRGEGPWYCGEHYFPGYKRKPGNWILDAIVKHAARHPELQPGYGDGTQSVRQRNMAYIEDKMKGGDFFAELPYDKESSIERRYRNGVWMAEYLKGQQKGITPLTIQEGAWLTDEQKGVK